MKNLSQYLFFIEEYFIKNLYLEHLNLTLEKINKFSCKNLPNLFPCYMIA